MIIGRSSIRLMNRESLQVSVAASLKNSARDAVVSGRCAVRFRVGLEWGEMRFEKRQQRDASIRLHGVIVFQSSANRVKPMVIELANFPVKNPWQRDLRQGNGFWIRLEDHFEKLPQIVI